MAPALSHGAERKAISQEDCFIRGVKAMDANKVWS